MESKRQTGILGRLFGSRQRGKPADSRDAVDPVCGMTVDPDRARGRGLAIRGGEEEFFFCSEGCKRAFEASPEQFGAAV